MSTNSADVIEQHRSIALKLYVKWLIKRDLLSNFDRPTTVPALFYQKNWPSEEYPLVEDILQFLTSFNIVSEASGTFVLSTTVDKIKAKIDRVQIEAYENHPHVKFIQYGLKLIEDRLEGGSGNWDLTTFGYIFERGYGSQLYTYLASQLNNILQIDRLSYVTKKPEVAIYAQYPENFIPMMKQNLPDIQNLTIITPNDKLRSKAVTYCEITGQCDFSYEIVSRDNMTDGKYDLVFIPNGIEFYHPFLNQVSYFNQRLKKAGQLYLGLSNQLRIQTGIEPLLKMHPNYFEIPKDKEVIRLINANGFSYVERLGPLKYFYYCIKEEY